MFEKEKKGKSFEVRSTYTISKICNIYENFHFHKFVSFVSHWPHKTYPYYIYAE